MSPDRRIFPYSFRRRSPDRQIVVNETGTVLQAVRERELRGMDPYRFVASEDALPFPTHELIRNPVQTMEQVIAALSHQSTSMIHRPEGGIELAEFVDLEKIVIPQNVCVRAKRGIPTEGPAHVLHYARVFQEDGFELNPPFDSLRADLVDDTYYVTNGVYRAAALRALRIPFVPMYVRGNHH